VQQQDVRRNYISIVSDAIERERSAGTAARSQPETMKDFVGRLTAVLKRRLSPDRHVLADAAGIRRERCGLRPFGRDEGTLS
jgi:hypothetical protein